MNDESIECVRTYELQMKTSWRKCLDKKLLTAYLEEEVLSPQEAQSTETKTSFFISCYIFSFHFFFARFFVSETFRLLHIIHSWCAVCVWTGSMGRSQFQIKIFSSQFNTLERNILAHTQTHRLASADCLAHSIPSIILSTSLMHERRKLCSFVLCLRKCLAFEFSLLFHATEWKPNRRTKNENDFRWTDNGFGGFCVRLCVCAVCERANVPSIDCNKSNSLTSDEI